MKKRHEKKKQQKIKRAKARVLARRKHLREINQNDNKQFKIDLNHRDRIEPIRNVDYNVRTDESLDPTIKRPKSNNPIKDKMILAKLERNREILKELEDTYFKEQESREKLNAELEAEDAHTLKQKLDLLAEKSKDNL